MIYTEAPQSEDAVEHMQAEPMQNVAAQAEPVLDLGQELHALKQVVFAQNKKMAEAFIRITNKIESIRGNFSVSTLRNYLISECGLNRADVNMYMKFERTIGDHKKTITAKGLPVTVVKALFNAPEAVRVEAMQHVEAGSFFIQATLQRSNDDSVSRLLTLQYCSNSSG